MLLKWKLTDYLTGFYANQKAMCLAGNLTFILLLSLEYKHILL